MDKAFMLQAALDCARDNNYRLMTRKMIADYADCPESLVSHYMGPMENVRFEVMTAAVHVEDHIVVAQGLFFKDEVALKAPAKLKEQARAYLVYEGGAE